VGEGNRLKTNCVRPSTAMYVFPATHRKTLLVVISLLGLLNVIKVGVLISHVRKYNPF